MTRRSRALQQTPNLSQGARPSRSHRPEPLEPRPARVTAAVACALVDIIVATIGARRRRASARPDYRTPNAGPIDNRNAPSAAGDAEALSSDVIGCVQDTDPRAGARAGTVRRGTLQQVEK